MKIHIVQKGDTLWKLAKKYGVSFEALKTLNTHLSNPDLLMPGMKLKIPTPMGEVKHKEAPISSMFGVKEQPIVKQKPIVKEQPIVKQQPIVKEQPIVKQQPIVKEQPIVKQQPIVKEQPIVKQQPIMKEQPIVKQKPIVKEQPIVKQQPIMKEQPIVKQKPIIKEKPIVKQPPIFMPKEVPVPPPVMPHMDINNYYMLNMANLSVTKPPKPIKEKKLPEIPKPPQMAPVAEVPMPMPAPIPAPVPLPVPAPVHVQVPVPVPEVKVVVEQPVECIPVTPLLPGTGFCYPPPPPIQWDCIPIEEIQCVPPAYEESVDLCDESSFQHPTVAATSTYPSMSAYPMPTPLQWGYNPVEEVQPVPQAYEESVDMWEESPAHVPPTLAPVAEVSMNPVMQSYPFQAPSMLPIYEGVHQPQTVTYEASESSSFQQPVQGMLSAHQLESADCGCGKTTIGTYGPEKKQVYPQHLNPVSPVSGTPKQGPYQSSMPGMPKQSPYQSPTSGIPKQSPYQSSMPGTPKQSSYQSPMPGMSSQSPYQSPMPGMSSQSSYQSPMPGMSSQSPYQSSMPGMPTQLPYQSPMSGIPKQSPYQSSMPGMSSQPPYQSSMPGMPNQMHYANPMSAQPYYPNPIQATAPSSQFPYPSGTPYANEAYAQPRNVASFGGTPEPFIPEYGGVRAPETFGMPTFAEESDDF